MLGRTAGFLDCNKWHSQLLVENSSWMRFSFFFSTGYLFIHAISVHNTVPPYNGAGTSTKMSSGQATDEMTALRNMIASLETHMKIQRVKRANQAEKRVRKAEKKGKA
jgi:hypothetical protein